VAGKQVVLECLQTPSGTPGEPVRQAGAEDIKAPKKGKRLGSGFKAGKYDLCTIALERRGVQALIPLTQKGAVFEDEALFAGDLLSIVDVADSLSTGGHFPSAPQVAAKVGNGAVVALAAPTDTPPAGKYGFYSDANQHIAVVVLSSAGRRLFFEVSGDTISTNVLAQVNFIEGT
jgi:hypothetical protein